jgi:hypothetical protein
LQYYQPSIFISLKLSLAFPDKIYECISDLHSACHMSHPSHHTSWSHCNNTVWSAWIMKLLIV